ncbi:MAG: RAMP superfamily protein [Brasilonema octagenarum HA4186-MV1]|jgi:CRISPR-associated protein Cmr6|nr:RAMP superfamily protein [Brasilonema octagenarum HA4186-MV1]
MYTGITLIELLERQHADPARPTLSGLFKAGVFTLQWRVKVGSFPHPDLDTLVSAGEPCGAWEPTRNRPTTKRNVGENWNTMKELPVRGYIPGSSIRGLVRAWAKKRPEIQPRMRELLGYQEENSIYAGKIEFLDAWPIEPTKLTLDIVNPQQDFQVFHEGQGKPLSAYTLGDGENSIQVKVAIRGIPGRVTDTEVGEVWSWIEQALTLYGVGSRTASGYGTFKGSSAVNAAPDPEHEVKEFQFTLYSQGCAGPNMQTMELRPSHWRGWLRSWMLRFFLGVMSKEDAQTTVGELMGTIEPKAHKGCVRLQMFRGKTWGKESDEQPTFYVWKGELVISAPRDILNKIILPIIRFAVMVGGVGRGWRRPLHIFWMEKRNSDEEASRGTYLTLKHEEVESKRILFGLPSKAETWNKLYQDWLKAVQSRWSNRFAPGNNCNAEVFSPKSCAIYIVPGSQKEPVDFANYKWEDIDAEDTRGKGMNLIYSPPYKRNPDVGGNAAGGGNAHCSWVSIKRIPIKAEGTKEIVCLFMGGETPNSDHVRSHFLNDLAKMTGAVHLFGVQPPGN